MISLIHYDEFGKNMGFRSMKNYLLDEPYDGQEVIAEYLDNGRKTFASVSPSVDVFTGESIPGELVGMTYGEYDWISSLSYYVRKYNLRLPEDFENKVFRLSSK